MPSFLPKLFKSKKKKKKSNTQEEQESKERKRSKAFRLPKRRKLRELLTRFSKGKRDDGVIQKQQETAPPTPSIRRGRRPNMNTTQRKLAASKKRLRVQNVSKDASTVSKEVPRRVTEITEDDASREDAPSSTVESELQDVSSSVRRSVTHPAFLMRGARASQGIEVEFIDELDSPEPIWKNSVLPMSMSVSSTDKEGEIGVEWKMTGAGVSPGEGYPNRTPSRHFSPPSDLSSVQSYRTGQGVMSKSTKSSDCGSASGSSDFVMDAWSEYRRDRVIKQLAALKIQQPMQSQCFEDKKALKASSQSQQIYELNADATDRQGDAPQWIQTWNSSFRSLPSSGNEEISKEGVVREKSVTSKIPKPRG